MTKEQERLLDRTKRLIAQADALSSLKDHAGWKLVESVLTDLRREALEDVLAGGTKKEESVFVRIGHAQAVNVLFNVLTQLIDEGVSATLDQDSLLKTIREDERLDAEQARVVRHYGHGEVTI